MVQASATSSQHDRRSLVNSKPYTRFILALLVKLSSTCLSALHILKDCVLRVCSMLDVCVCVNGRASLLLLKRRQGQTQMLWPSSANDSACFSYQHGVPMLLENLLY